MINKTLRHSRRLSFVPRWVVMPVLRRQSVAEHSFHVAQTVLWLLPVHASAATEMGSRSLGFQFEVVSYALNHDIKEAVEGDSPSPNKVRADPDPNDQVSVITKVADILEAIAFVSEEKAMGNSYGTDSVDLDLRMRLHAWWLAFEWNSEAGPKPITSDIIKLYLKETVPAVHPVMEE